MVKETPPPPRPRPDPLCSGKWFTAKSHPSHMTYLRLMGAPLFTPDKGQAGTLPIPILCIINDELNCFVPTDESEQNIC